MIMHKRSTQGVAIVPDANNDVSGIGALSCTSLIVNGSSVSSPPSYVVDITPGTAASNKALVLGFLQYCSTKDMKADLMTKPITAVQFISLRSKLGIQAPSTAESSGSVVKKAPRPASVYQ
ncbi:unnamed protein product [Phytophthora lilii]|uniref:Unnamed protein product n=1 Tax=Phytophthora lilii TaxID=2077276 RepID=A0A9W7CX95_9STRA|nr:unnamed protein product [Phytophthora lilii]